MKILITGTAGFIGFHVANRLIKRGDIVFGIDSINDYYPVSLKLARLSQAGIDHPGEETTCSIKHANYSFQKLDITDEDALDKLFIEQKFDFFPCWAPSHDFYSRDVHPERVWYHMAPQGAHQLT